MSRSGAPYLSSALQVAIVGPGTSVTEAIATLARDVGARLADAGCVIVTGGGGGVMAAAAEGAIASGGIVIGLLPGSDRAAAVGPVSAAIATGLGELRNGLIVRTADVVIAVGGSWGTTSEIALAMRTGVPVVAVAGWHFTDDQGDPIELPRATTAAGAVSTALSLARGSAG